MAQCVGEKARVPSREAQSPTPRSAPLVTLQVTYIWASRYFHYRSFQPVWGFGRRHRYPPSLPRITEGDWWRWGPLPGLSNVAAMAATEELFWRGFLQEALLRLGPKRYSLPLAVTVVAAIWALLHVVWADYEEISAVVPLFIVAICFGVVAHRWGVMVTTVVHVAFNICVFLSLRE